MYKEAVNSTKTDFQNAHKLSKEILCLPIYPNLEKPDQLRIISAIKKFSNI